MAQQVTEPIATALKDFQNALSPTQQAELLAIHGASPPDVQAVLAFTGEVDRTAPRRNSRCVASRLDGTLRSVQQFTDIVAFDSLYLPQSNFASFFEKLSELFMKIQAYCPRFSEYQYLHSDSERLQRALCVYYAIVVQFCTKAVEVISRSGYLQAIKALWVPFNREFGEFAAYLRQQSEHVGEEIRLASEQAADKERRLQVAERKDAARARRIGKLLHSKLSSLSAEDRAWRVQNQLRERLAQKQKLLDALSTYDYLGPLRRERKKRYGRTGLWLSECREYQDWLHDDKFGTFWLSGILGSGKTVLTTAVIDDLLNQPSQKQVRVAFFLCQHDDAASLEARTILGCLLRQLLTVESISEVVENQLLQLSNSSSSNIEALDLLFSELLDARKDNPVIVIDALDEVPRSERDVLLSIFGQIRSFTRPCIKILISSRQDIRRELETAFPNQYRRKMNCAEVDTDIATYIDLSIEDKRFKGDLIVGDADLVHVIKAALISGSNGMFLWVFFQIEEICAQDTDEGIRRTIRSLPRDLPATYQRALERVVKNRKADVARKMFRWVAAAKRPLSLMEIREAIAVEPCQPSSQKDKLVNDVDQLVPWCGNLLVLDEEEGLVHFAHHSVKDYMLFGEVPEISSHSFRIDIQDVDHEAGKICCTYLNFSDFERQVIHVPQMRRDLDPKAIVKTSLSASTGPTMTIALLRLHHLRKARKATEASDIWRQLHLTSLGVAPMWPQNLQTRFYFLAYASEYWLHHTSQFNKEDHCWSLFRRLVLAEKTALAAKPWSMEEWKAFGAKVQNYILKTEHRGLLSLAVLEQLIYARANLPRVMGHIYASHGSDEIFHFHLSITGLVENFWSTWDPVLIIAAGKGRLDWVKKVLELAGGFESVLAHNKAKKSNPAPAPMDTFLAQSWDLAWRRAEREESCEMLDLLLTYKAIMLGKLKGLGFEELHAAALTGNQQIARRVIDDYVSLNELPSTTYAPSDSILAAAASRGNLEVVERLLYAGAEVNSQTGGLRKTALDVAIKHGDTHIVIALLAAGADVNPDRGLFSLTPLAAAAGYKDIMLLLLLAGAYFKDLAGYYQLQDCGDLTKDESIIQENWRAYLHCYFYLDLKTDCYRPRPGLQFSDRIFFHALLNHVKSRCGTEMESIKVKEAVEGFLKQRLESNQRQDLSKENEENMFQLGDAASEKNI